MERLFRGKGLGVLAVLLIVAMCLAVALLGCSPPEAEGATATPGVSTPGVFYMPLVYNGPATGSFTAFKVKAPYSFKLLGVSGWCGHADLTDTDETYEWDIQGSTAGYFVNGFVVNTPDAVQEATVLNTTVADEETLTVGVTLGGTTPAIANCTIGITGARR